MKQFFSFLTFLCLFFCMKANAQCDVSKPVISNIIVTAGTPCTISFDVEFDLTANGGNKYVAFYVYTGSLPANFYSPGGKNVPSTTTINGAPVLATVEINTDISTSTTSANYVAQGSSGNPTSFKASRPFTKTATGVTDQNRFKVSGITVSVPNCNSAVDLKLDVGSSNANSFGSFQCLAPTVSFRANDPVLNGQIQCASPRSFTFSVNTSTATQVTFSAYSDAARTVLLQAPAGFTYSGNGAINPPMAITTYSNITLNVAANSNTSFGAFRYQSANGTANPVYLSLSLASNTQNTNSLQIDNGCAALPVTFKSFQAVRDGQNVQLTWETASELNSKSFEVQRKTTGDWTTVATVASKAEGGRSSSVLAYSATDANAEKGASQYRIKQLDLDGGSKLSETKSIKGLGQAASIGIFPNPAPGGQFSVVFGDNGNYNVHILDASGRAVQQLNNAKGSLSVSGLKSGIYTVVSDNLQSAARTTQKIVVL